MNPCAELQIDTVSIAGARPSRNWFYLELALFALALLWLNWSLLHGVCNSAMSFLPSAVRAGQWWRLLTHPFVHITWYHLLLDGTAFFLLYNELQEKPRFKRAGYVLASAAGSLLVPLFTDPTLAQKGLCGLSGIGHGLMIVTALDSIAQSDKAVARIGYISFVLVIGKSLIEVLTGKILFAFLYFGMVGDPVAATHVGGVLGALILWFCFNGNHGRGWRRGRGAKV